MVGSLITLWAVALTLPVFAEETASLEPVQIKSEADEVAGEADDTQKLISQLTIAMAAEVIDERTFAVRDTSKGGKQIHLRLGNTGPTPRASLDDGEYAEKVRVAKESLAKLVDKQMIWYKAGPDAVQSMNSTVTVPTILADVWSIDGKHISSFLQKDGHLSDEQAYETDLGKDILTVASEEEKKESYKKLEEALKESEKAKQAAAKAVQGEEEDAAESIGLPGSIGLAMVLAIAFGVATNFGRPTNKKVNLNRKRGPFERFWLKLKGA